MIRCILLRYRLNVFRLNFSTDAATAGYVKIGSVKAALRKSKSPHLTATGFGVSEAPTSVLSHLKWLLQKDALKQDVFLIGVPGSFRSQVVLQYLELSGREYEYLSITRDTTEADIKQRREIRDGTAFYTDLCAVRAALNGRVLVIDGVEKAERNVLPILNSLLESREMQLDDGRFLMPATKYDDLVKEIGLAAVRQKKLERVSEDFLVISMGLPVPPFKGHSLDPPLRSRFQCRHIPSPSFSALHIECAAVAPRVRSDRLSSLISLCLAINSAESKSLSLPRFPLDHLPHLARIWNLNPQRSAASIFEMGYPSKTLMKSGSQQGVLKEFLTKFGVEEEKREPKIVSVNGDDIATGNRAVTLQWDSDEFRVNVPVGTIADDVRFASTKPFVRNPESDRLLAEMVLSHSFGDFCLLGPKGSGKTTLVEEFARLLRYRHSTMTLYQDMNSRELLQERRMLPNGDTVWEDSVLVDCAKSGRLCVLDGIERIHWSALEVLAPLIHHRQIDLFDGTRLLSADRYRTIVEKTGFTKEQLSKRGVFEIHPSFRIVAVGDSESESKWLTEQLIALFPSFHSLRPLSVASLEAVVASIVPQSEPSLTSRVLTFVESLNRSSDVALRGVANSLSIRKLIHILHRHAAHRDEEVSAGLRRAALSRFLPPVTHDAFEKFLQNARIDDAKHTSQALPSPGSQTKEGFVRIGNSLVRRSDAADRTMVPNVLFYDNAEHLSVMSDMARDMELGSHLLLIGNQGVGKNKITDRFLHLINRSRHYLQLHRDTTVQSLTVRSTVIDGKLVLDDSPLVKAAREGSILVVDEADKAPLHVVAVLKSLLDIGVMRLADGRTIEPPQMAKANGGRSIALHPNFRIIMLANRPGFPFLGNDLFSILGDLFSVHIVDNPSRDSEIQMLKKYAPDVEVSLLSKLCSVFDELRSLADQSLLPYPYSIRELVNIAKHIQKFPNDGLTLAIKNVFDFDSYTSETLETVGKVLRKYGIPFGSDQSADNVLLAKWRSIPRLQRVADWTIRHSNRFANITTNRFPLARGLASEAAISTVRLESEHMRSSFFSEQEHFCEIPIGESNLVSDIASSGGRVAVASVNPPTVYVIDSADGSTATEVDISSLFPPIRGSFRPRIKLAFLSPHRILAHEEMTNLLIDIDLESRRTVRLSTDESSVVASVINKFSPFTINSGKRYWRMNPDSMAIFECGGRRIRFIDRSLSTIFEISLPEGCSVENVLMVNEANHLLAFRDENGPRLGLVSLQGDGRCSIREVEFAGDSPRNALAGRMVNDSFLIAADDFYALHFKNFVGTLGSGEVVASRRDRKMSLKKSPSQSILDETCAYAHPTSNSSVLEGGSIARALPMWKIPVKAIEKDSNISLGDYCGFLEVVNSDSELVTYLPVPALRHRTYYPGWADSLAPAGFVVTRHGDDSVITCDVTGGVRKWQVTQEALKSALVSWQKMFGEENESLRIEYGKDDFDFSKLNEPKVGKFDPDNVPHVGGGTWAGGTGGYNTAGLGGVGGPFRLDAGHDVHQLPQSAKDAVPEHILKKAREIAKNEYRKRLKEIEMSEYDADAYKQLYSKIEKQTQMLRTVLDALEAKEKERQWTKHQTHGDLDDAKLVEGVVGEKTIFRRRTDVDPEVGTLQKPKRIRFSFDVSGSMYRFNGYDHRLQRSIESAMLVMEAFQGKQSKIRYDLIGHSGEDSAVSFVKADQAPANEKERMDVLKRMIAHSQFCMSGDSTLESITSSVKDIAKEEADERFVIVISDANFDRYGITTKHIVRCMESDETVNTFLILIGSLGQQADRLQDGLPPGRAFVCSDTSQMPHILQNIFSSALLK